MVDVVIVVVAIVTHMGHTHDGDTLMAGTHSWQGHTHSWNTLMAGTHSQDTLMGHTHRTQLCKIRYARAGAAVLLLFKVSDKNR